MGLGLGSASHSPVRTRPQQSPLIPSRPPTQPHGSSCLEPRLNGGPSTRPVLMGSPIPGSPCGHPLATAGRLLATGHSVSMWHEGPLTTQRLMLAPPPTSSRPPLVVLWSHGTPALWHPRPVQGLVLGA